MDQDKLRLWLNEAWQYALIIIAVVVLRTLIGQPFYVPSGSMEPTLQIGDELIASKFPYGLSRYSVPFDLAPASDQRLFGSLPKRGDVVVFRLPRDPDVVYVKRVVGLPGDHLRMDAGHLVINGETLPRADDGPEQMEVQTGMKVPARRLIETLPGGVQHPILKVTWSGPLDNIPELTVPEGMLFMMGDDRDNSLDSRVPASQGGVGFVPLENLVGRAEVIIGSWDLTLADKPASEWLGGLRLSRFFNRVK